MASPWSEQYRHPLWQRKRLEVLEAAEFTCQHCFDSETQLHVHHKRYVKGRKIWEYGLDELEVLCEPCHEEAHAMKDALFDVLGCVHPMMGPWREAASLIAGFYSTEKTVEKRIDLQVMFYQAPLQFTLGVVAAVLYRAGDAEETAVSIGRAVLEMNAQPSQWGWIKKGFEFLERIQGTPVLDGSEKDAKP